MDYKKAYEDALERAKDIYNENPSSSTAKFVCGQIFPELKESEDERIRKELLEEIEFIIPHDDETDSEGLILPSYHARIDRYKSYLERQQEQQPAEWNDAERKKLYSDGYYSSRSNLALDFMHYLDEHRPEGKMCLSSGECEQLQKAFKTGDVETIVRYINKYQQPAQVADASKMERLNVDDLHEWSMRFAPGFREMIEDTAYHFWNLAISARNEQPEVDIEKIIEQTYHNGSVADTLDMDHVTYENIARHFYELGVGARKER